MKCQKCFRDFEEKDIDLSHDVPCYLFLGHRKAQKNLADKWGRHNLCKPCHETYEKTLRQHLRETARSFAEDYFKK